MEKYSFCKKDGKIKQFYIPICEYIISAKICEHIVTIGRHDDVVDKYECYTTPRIELSASNRRNYVVKIQEICSNFSITTKEWYSYRDLSVEFHGENVKEMIGKLRELLEGVHQHIR